MGLGGILMIANGKVHLLSMFVYRFDGGGKPSRGDLPMAAQSLFLEMHANSALRILGVSLCIHRAGVFRSS